MNVCKQEFSWRFDSYVLLRFIAIAFVLIGAVMTNSSTTDEVVWSNVPIKLDLQVNKEHTLVFEQQVEVGLSTSLHEKLTVENIAGSIYLVAKTSFPKHRLLIRQLSRGDVFVFDLSASREAKLSDRTVVRTHSFKTTQQTRPKRLTYAELTRFAAASVYGPRRLAASLPGLRSAPVLGEANGLMRGVGAEIEAIASWRTNDRKYLTVIRVRNLWNQSVELHPHMLRGEWLAATFQHYRLLPSGTEADQTHLYLISSEPFHVALGEQS